MDESAAATELPIGIIPIGVSNDASSCTAQAVATQTKPISVGSLARAGGLCLHRNGFSRIGILRYLKPRLV
ncbi:MAG: hypothetical protein NZ874_01285 [Fimbriimonadales bacterium]|nr:hypothetical protein [Fimbriimonadales bacterium]